MPLLTNTLQLPSTDENNDEHRLSKLHDSTRVKQCFNQGMDTRCTHRDSASSAGLHTSNEPRDTQMAGLTLGHREGSNATGLVPSLVTGCSQACSWVSRQFSKSEPADPWQRYTGPDREDFSRAFCKVKAKWDTQLGRISAHISRQAPTDLPPSIQPPSLSQSTQPPYPETSTTKGSKQNPTSPSADGAYAPSLNPHNCQLPENPDDKLQSSSCIDGLDWPAEIYYGPQGYQAGFGDTNSSC
jgi:hypothetical protein